MEQWIDEEFEREFNERHDLYIELINKLIDLKKKERDDINKKLEDIDKAFRDWKAYQDFMNEIARLDGEIEDAIVRGEVLNIKAENLKITVENLTIKKDSLLDEKRISNQKYDDMKGTFQSQEDLRQKKLQSRLNNNKSQTVKDLIANLELIDENNKETANKLTSEIENYDKLLKEKMYAQEHLDLETKKFDLDSLTVEQQDVLLKQLQDEIDKEQREVDKLVEEVDEAKKVNKEQDFIYRELQQDNSAQTAKRDFINSEYDYCTNVDKMEEEVFQKVITSNLSVNTMVEDFKSQLRDSKVDIGKVLSQRRTMAAQLGR